MPKQNEVLEYIRSYTDIYFERGHVACAYCPLLETYSRNQCRRTGEYIVNVHGTGFYCPLIFDEGGTNADQDIES